VNVRLLILAPLLLISACASHRPAPEIPLAEPVEAHRLPDSPLPMKIIEMPQALPLPGQLKPIDHERGETAPKSSGGPTASVAQANRFARIEPSREGYVNATQIWPYSAGALYQVYASPGRVTDIALENTENLISISAGDTVRWVIGDTVSGDAAGKRVHILVKPTRADLHTNLVVNTDRRTYHLELTATRETWMASVSWNYPQESLLTLTNANRSAQAAAPIAEGLALEHLQFRYEVTGDNPSWRPLRAFDDGAKVYIQFPPGIAQGEMPPLFVIGPVGEAQLVNYRVRAPYYIVDRLFGAAELRLGGKSAQKVRISRTDVKRDKHAKGLSP
jgi:P-type conjugative transfer protein TrbG